MTLTDGLDSNRTAPQDREPIRNEKGSHRKVHMKEKYYSPVSIRRIQIPGGKAGQLTWLDWCDGGTLSNPVFKARGHQDS